MATRKIGLLTYPESWQRGGLGPAIRARPVSRRAVEKHALEPISVECDLDVSSSAASVTRPSCRASGHHRHGRDAQHDGSRRDQRRPGGRTNRARRLLRHRHRVRRRQRPHHPAADRHPLGRARPSAGMRPRCSSGTSIVPPTRCHQELVPPRLVISRSTAAPLSAGRHGTARPDCTRLSAGARTMSARQARSRATRGHVRGSPARRGLPWLYVAPGVALSRCRPRAFRSSRPILMSFQRFTLNELVSHNTPFVGLRQLRPRPRRPERSGVAMRNSLLFTVVSIAFQFTIGLRPRDPLQPASSR